MEKHHLLHWKHVVLNEKNLLVGSRKIGFLYKWRTFAVSKLIHFDFLLCFWNLKVGDCEEEFIFAAVSQAN